MNTSVMNVVFFCARFIFSEYAAGQKHSWRKSGSQLLGESSFVDSCQADILESPLLAELGEGPVFTCHAYDKAARSAIQGSLLTSCIILVRKICAKNIVTLQICLSHEEIQWPTPNNVLLHNVSQYAGCFYLKALIV